MAPPERGDVLMRDWGEDRFDLVDYFDRTPLGTASSFREALAMAARYRGAVWQQTLDNRGRALTEPRLLLPRITRE